jgi:hypothetical protein
MLLNAINCACKTSWIIEGADEVEMGFESQGIAESERTKGGAGGDTPKAHPRP